MVGCGIGIFVIPVDAGAKCASRTLPFGSISLAARWPQPSLLEVSMDEKDVLPLSPPPHDLNREHATAYDHRANARVRFIRPPPPPPASSNRRRRPVPFRQKDLQRALKATQDAGLEVKKVEYDPISGKISISTADPNKPATEQSIIETWMANRVRAS